MATAKGVIKQRSADSLSIIAPAGRDPQTGRYKQHWQTVKRLPGETDKALRSRAERELRKLLTKVDEGEPIAKGRLTLADFIANEWLPAVKLNLTPRTASGYEAMMRDHVLPVIGNKSLRNLQPSDVERVYAGMAEKGLSGNSRLHVHRVLSQALKSALRKGKVARNVCDLVDAPRKDPFTIEPPTPEEVKRLIDKSSGTRIGVLIKLLSYTGLRLGEALGLRWQDVDLDAGALFVRQTRKLRVTGGGAYGSPKTERSRRRVDLAPELLKALREHRNQQFAFNLENGFVPAEDYVFQTIVGRSVVGMGHDHVYSVWKQVRKDAKLPRVRIHDLRHAAATFMIAAGIPVTDVSAILGHSQTSTTVNVYGHPVSGSGRRAVAEIEKALTI